MMMHWPSSTVTRLCWTTLGLSVPVSAKEIARDPGSVVDSRRRKVPGSLSWRSCSAEARSRKPWIAMGRTRENSCDNFRISSMDGSHHEQKVKTWCGVKCSEKVCSGAPWPKICRWRKAWSLREKRRPVAACRTVTVKRSSSSLLRRSCRRTRWRGVYGRWEVRVSPAQSSTQPCLIGGGFAFLKMRSAARTAACMPSSGAWCCSREAVGSAGGLGVALTRAALW
mmetsp:Transcript_16356/g.47950  ORF Transcript_16356/g.47950 Transcript_16356/m.47950 type:complete len:225 (-) Transcript_16356:28-702(-)